MPYTFVYEKANKAVKQPKTKMWIRKLISKRRHVSTNEHFWKLKTRLTLKPWFMSTLEGWITKRLVKDKKMLRICLWCVRKHATSSPFPCTSMEIHLWYYTYLWCIQIIPLSMMDIQRILWRWFWWNELQWVGWGYGQQQKYSQYFLVEPLEDQSIYSNN